MAEASSSRFADCPKCGALYVHDKGPDHCTVCGTARPAQPRIALVKGPAAVDAASSDDLSTPRRRQPRATVFAGVVATWGVVLAAIVWAVT